MQHDKFVVEGGKKLSGILDIAGNKNEALPILSACLMTDQKIELYNVPMIGDVLIMGDILRDLGADVQRDNNNPNHWTVVANEIDTEELVTRNFQKLRATITLAAPLLYRCGKVKIPVPGGDKIGKRRIDTHLVALQDMGVEIFEENDCYLLRAPHGLHGAELLLDEASVTGTENIIMAAVCAKGSTSIYNAACEPHVQQLCHFLNKMGAKISGIGSNLLSIEGVNSLHETTHTIDPDYLEIGSFIGLAATTNSCLTLRKANCQALKIILKAYDKLGIKCELKGEDLLIPANQEMVIKSDLRGAIPKIESATWPGIPADILSILLVTATQCEGSILIHEKMFESRLFFTDRLVGMGARIVLCDPHRAIINGPTTLMSDFLTSPDIRAGVALLIAAMCAKGTSKIDNVFMIDRGYENIDKRLNQVGASIERISD